MDLKIETGDETTMTRLTSEFGNFEVREVEDIQNDERDGVNPNLEVTVRIPRSWVEITVTLSDTVIGTFVMN